jgi:acetamidase/formamidase
LLADQLPESWLHVSRIDVRGAHFAGGDLVPVSPFCGVLGVAPAEPGVHSSVPPRRVGGNLDIKQLGPGATLYLPVEVEGALFGASDTHAAQATARCAARRSRRRWR